MASTALAVKETLPEVKQDKLVWVPQQGSQILFAGCPLFEVLYHGNRGGGKTDSLIMDFAKDVGKGYGADWRGILFRQTYKQLQDVIAKSKKWFFQIWERDVTVKYNEADHVWTWHTGEQLFLRQFAREADYWNFHGHEYPWIAWEELCNWADPIGYKRMMTCCRSSNAKVPRKYRSTTNPYGPGHNWVKFRFRLPAFDGVVIRDSVDDTGELEPPRIAIQGSLQENQLLLKADPKYRQKVLAGARNESERKAWDKGSWDIVAGGMFDEVWNPAFNVLEPFRIPDNWKINRSFDWGSSKPFSVGWWAESDGSDVQLADGSWMSTVRGDLFRIREWYGWNGRPNEGLRKLATEISEGIIERELKWGLRTQRGSRVKAGPADTSIFTVENGTDIAGDMMKVVRVNGKQYSGVTWLPADKRPGSRKTGWESIRKMLKAAHGKPGIPREEAGLFIFKTCDQFIRTVPVLPRDNDDLDDVDTKAEDHIGDETRYRVRMSGFISSSGRAVGMF
jgi:hypothetical protein